MNTKQRQHFVANLEAPIQRGSEVLPDMTRGPELFEALGLERDAVLHVKARELVGDTFVILAGRQFQSKKYPKAGPAWFLVCRGEGEYFSTILGGQVTGEALEAWANSGDLSPLEVTLEFVEGGDYNGYYTFHSDVEDVSEAEGPGF